LTVRLFDFLTVRLNFKLMKIFSKISTVLVLTVLMWSCDLIEPEPDNTLYIEQIKENPSLAEGLLLNAYRNMETHYSLEDRATDNAVSNNPNSEYRKMATGEWSAMNNPLAVWNQAYTQLYYINLFLDVYDEMVFSVFSPKQNTMHKNRLKGEAHGLRSYYNFQLLRNHSGITNDNVLRTFPIVTKPLSAVDEPVVERATFDDAIAQIMADLDTAINNLPAVYADKFDADHNATLGSRFKNRMDGNSAKALKSRVALWAASPAFNLDNNIEAWENAALISGNLITELGGISGLDANGHTFWTNPASKDIIWRRDIFQSNVRERENFPPSHWGRGNTNPTQDFVDAFPMANGYPINNLASNYDSGNPYQNRDPRLNLYVVYNGATLKTPVQTYIGAGRDGLQAEVNSTRTGYYLRKMLNNTVNLDPNSSQTNAQYFYAYFRATEVFLNYAEAANEAYGPKGTPNGIAFSAYDVISAIRKRAGIEQPDNYIEEISSSKENFRQLILNERRIELSFEDFRFWDIRRLNDVETMKKTVGGVLIEKEADDTYKYNFGVEVEKREYKDYMIYGPVPYNETIKYDKMPQNNGW
jgi:starch-binding outer membrane protein, SusD/RagB family